MNDQVKKPTPEQVLDHQRTLRAIQGGMQFLLDETVTAAIRHSEGIVDLKWLLRKLMAGEWGLNMDPQNPAGRLTTAQEDLSKDPPKDSTPIAGLPGNGK